MAIINVALSDTFDTWRQKTNTLGADIGDMALLDSDFAATDLVSALNEIRAGEEFTQIDLPDSTGAAVGRIKLGDGDDLEIYHDGSNSYIDDAGTGILNIRGNTGIAIGKYTGEAIAEFTADGAVTLRHDNAIKFETTSTGITVSGNIATSDNTSGQLMIANGTNFVSTPVSGDATLAANGTLTVANGAITSAKIADGTITGTDIATDTIAAGNIAANAVGSSEIAAGAVGASEIADGSITSTEFNNVVTLIIYDSSGSAVKTLRTPGS